jgi:hypothetical protein
MTRSVVIDWGDKTKIDANNFCKIPFVDATSFCSLFEYRVPRSVVSISGSSSTREARAAISS